MSQTVDVTLCSGGDSTCGQIFRHKTTAGPCAMCTLLGALDETSDEYKRKEKWPQCLGCGVCYSRLPGGALCGECKTADGLVDRSVEAARAARADAFQVRMHPGRAATAPGPSTERVAALGPVQNALPPPTVVNGPTIPMTTESLNRFRDSTPGHSSHSHSSGRVIYVGFNLRMDAKAYKKIGFHCTPFPETTPMDDVVQSALNRWEPTWTKQFLMKIIPDDISVRFTPNKIPIANALYGTLADFHRIHSTGPHQGIYAQSIPKEAGRIIGSTYIGLDLVLDSDM
ncbi:hypothetical protein FA95DRAFT_1600005, partial [Auriscalpium vulgare]